MIIFLLEFVREEGAQDINFSSPSPPADWPSHYCHWPAADKSVSKQPHTLTKVPSNIQIQVKLSWRSTFADVVASTRLPWQPLNYGRWMDQGSSWTSFNICIEFTIFWRLIINMIMPVLVILKISILEKSFFSSWFSEAMFHSSVLNSLTNNPCLLLADQMHMKHEMYLGMQPEKFNSDVRVVWPPSTQYPGYTSWLIHWTFLLEININHYGLPKKVIVDLIIMHCYVNKMKMMSSKWRAKMLHEMTSTFTRITQQFMLSFLLFTPTFCMKPAKWNETRNEKWLFKGRL